MFFQKLKVNFFNLWFLQEHIPLLHNIRACGKYTLDVYDIMANNQNLYAEYECDFHFRNHTDLLYTAL